VLLHKAAVHTFNKWHITFAFHCDGHVGFRVNMATRCQLQLHRGGLRNSLANSANTTMTQASARFLWIPSPLISAWDMWVMWIITRRVFSSEKVSTGKFHQSLSTKFWDILPSTVKIQERKPYSFRIKDSKCEPSNTVLARSVAHRRTKLHWNLVNLSG